MSVIDDDKALIKKGRKDRDIESEKDIRREREREGKRPQPTQRARSEYFT